ncbi:MAG TPA: ABC transporter permease [Thermoanaerobaculia bacterium]|nr:ABC transporter permease [Thermoanaerobaculia bacterium]
MPFERGHGLLRWGGAVTLLVLLAAAAAPWISPHDPRQQLDPASARHRPPGTRLAVVRLADGATLLADAVERTPTGLRVQRLGSWRSLPASQVLNLAPRGVDTWRTYPLGTDRYGRDVASRLLWGGRVSLRVALLAVALALTLGVLIGAVAGLGPAVVDAVLMRGVDALMAFPRLFLVLAVAALWRSGELAAVVVLGGTGWMEVARLTRGEVLRLRGLDFVQAARAMGAPPWRIAFVHVLPLAVVPLFAHTALRVGDTILTESALSFLGFGVTPPTPSWGNLIADGQDVLLDAWWVAALPGVAIAVTVLGFALLGDGLRAVLDPRSR